MGGNAPRYTVDYDARTVYDFLLSLAAAPRGFHELPEDNERWLQQARAKLPADVLAGAFVGGSEGEGVASELAGLVVLHPDITDAAGFVEYVEELTPREIVEALVRVQAPDCDVDDVDRLLIQARSGDEAARVQVEDLCGWPVDDAKLATLAAIVHDPVATGARLRIALHAWLEPYREIEERVRRAIERDLANRRAESELSASDAVERATGGIRLAADPSVRRVILAPSYFARPYNYVFSGEDWRLFCYPMSEDAIEERDVLAPPASTVTLYHALSDPSRLRVLRLLASRDMYMTEIAQQLELSKPTIKHHLAQLRAAGLLTMTDDGALTYYSLRRDRLDQVGLELKRYLS